MKVRRQDRTCACLQACTHSVLYCQSPSGVHRNPGIQVGVLASSALHAGWQALTATFGAYAFSAGRCQLQLALYAEDLAAEDPAPLVTYPLNALRNRALQMATTEVKCLFRSGMVDHVPLCVCVTCCTQGLERIAPSPVSGAAT